MIRLFYFRAIRKTFIPQPNAEKMDFLRKLFAQNKQNVRGFVLKYEQSEDLWYVLRESTILYVGNEASSRMYIGTLCHEN
jgi:hypothetical protein